MPYSIVVSGGNVTLLAVWKSSRWSAKSVLLSVRSTCGLSPESVNEVNHCYSLVTLACGLWLLGQLCEDLVTRSSHSYLNNTSTLV